MNKINVIKELVELHCENSFINLITIISFIISVVSLVYAIIINKHINSRNSNDGILELNKIRKNDKSVLNDNINKLLVHAYTFIYFDLISIKYTDDKNKSEIVSCIETYLMDTIKLCQYEISCITDKLKITIQRYDIKINKHEKEAVYIMLDKLSSIGYYIDEYYNNMKNDNETYIRYIIRDINIITALINNINSTITFKNKYYITYSDVLDLISGHEIEYLECKQEIHSENILLYDNDIYKKIDIFEKFIYENDYDKAHKALNKMIQKLNSRKNDLFEYKYENKHSQ